MHVVESSFPTTRQPRRKLSDIVVQDLADRDFNGVRDCTQMNVYTTTCEGNRGSPISHERFYTSVVRHRAHFPDSTGCAKFMRQTCVFLLSQDKTAVEKQLHGQIVLKAVRKYTQVRAFVCSPVHHFPSSVGNLYDFDDERPINRTSGRAVPATASNATATATMNSRSTAQVAGRVLRHFI